MNCINPCHLYTSDDFDEEKKSLLESNLTINIHPFIHYNKLSGDLQQITHLVVSWPVAFCNISGSSSIFCNLEEPIQTCEQAVWLLETVRKWVNASVCPGNLEVSMNNTSSHNACWSLLLSIEI